MWLRRKPWGILQSCPDCHECFVLGSILGHVFMISFTWSQHSQGKAAPSRQLLWPPAAPPLCCGTGINLAVAWTGAKKGFSLCSCTRANAAIREREARGYWAWDLEGPGWSCPFWWKLLLHRVRLSVKPQDRDLSFSVWWEALCSVFSLASQ